MHTTARFVILLLALCLAPRAGGQTLRTENVFLIVPDGLRWQEVFTGADERLINRENGVRRTELIRGRFWRETEEERREALMPFLWSIVRERGQIFGNLFKGSDAKIVNPWRVSYPGYSEIFCGFPNEHVKDNRRVMNPDVTVFEFLHQRPDFQGRVAAFGTWDLYPAIFNTARCGFPVDDGMGPITFGVLSAEIERWNRARAEIPYRWPASCFDALLFRPALEWIRLNQPRLVFIGLGETDEWAHEGNYEQYLLAARRVDDYLRELWEACESMPRYAGRTSFIVVCDHGRGGDNVPGLEGGALAEWRDHNAGIAGAEQIWIAVYGPDTPSLGDRTNAPPVTQSQVAATIAALLGIDYPAAQPRAHPPLEDVLRR